MSAAESPVAAEFCNLNAEQLEAIRGHIKNVTVQDGLTESDFQKLLPHWGCFAAVAFAKLGKANGLTNLPVSTFIAQVNLLEGIASDQAEALTKLFDAKWQDAIVACAGNLLQLPSNESSALLAFLQKDKSTTLTKMLTSNRLLGELVHLPFMNLLSSPTPVMPNLSGNTTLLTSYPSPRPRGGSLLFGGLEASVAELGRCVDELEETLAGLARKLLGVPSGSHTLESLSAGNTDGVDHLVLGEDLVDEDLQTLLSPLDLVGDGPSVELDLHNVGLLVAIIQRRVCFSVAQLAIRSHIPIEFRDNWQLLFSSNEHGSSFSKMAQRVDGQGPCLVVIRSTNGHVFGLFASHGFVSGPTYTGDSLSFLFSLIPSIGIHEATGFCKKYCYLNQQQETLPNGMGIGCSSDDNWSLFLWEDYGRGIACANSSAFEKCDIAGEKNFEIHTLEVWRVGPPPAVKHAEKSILDKDPQAQALLELAGKEMHSTPYRDPVPLLSDGEDD
ncbi:hypothetical protein PRIPAC_78431 [Pristionchus pacificus]|uniref:MTOR-associated protein MEAK7 n=1 Tax=Pristionchus pacificus TaxID=54126 RepID=A0A2A6CL05_PRIPA|nr:hypothetical protein PRIPAC_78431 [Pristionchus pacificus]|eukprot:PDM78882.1 hypothetical protein PRIPAC_31461 [Pristionchus pacificus]